jgi:PAS domain S-box-containing protein
MSEINIVYNDFCFLFFALAFFLTFFVSLSLKKRLADRDAWKCLAFYALVQACYFLIQLILQFKRVLPANQSIALVFAYLSHLFLWGFAINITDRLGEPSVFKKFWYIPVLAGLSGLFFAPKAFILTKVLFLALPAVLLSLKVFFAKEAFKVRVKSHLHLMVGLSLLSFHTLRTFQCAYPVVSDVFAFRLIKCILAICFAVFLWLSLRRVDFKARSDYLTKSHRHLEASAILAVLVVFTLGLFGTGLLARMAFVSEKRAKHSYASSFELLMQSNFSQADLLVSRLADSLLVNAAALTPANESLTLANEILDTYAVLMPQAVVYIMDKDGNTIASSNRETELSFVGKNFAFRPYFQEALAGKPANFLALGKVSKQYGYYSAMPLKDAGNDVVGVVVYKMTLTEKSFPLPEAFPVALINDAGDVIISNKSNQFWKKLLAANSHKFVAYEVPETRETRFTYSFSLVEPRAFSGARNMFLWKYRLKSSGWSFLLLDFGQTMVWARMFGLSLTLLVCLICVGVVIIWSLSLIKAEEIEANAKIYETLVEGSSNIVVLLDIYGNILAANYMANNEFGLKDCENAHQRLPEYWDKESAPKVREALQKTLSGEKITIEASRINATGTKSFWEIVLNPVIEGVGLPTKVVGIFHDFTQRKLATLELRQEKDLTANLLHTARVIIILLDKVGKIERVNKYFYDLTGYKPEDIIGQSWIEHFVPKKEKARTSSFFRNFIRTSDAKSLDTQIITVDGRILEIEWKNKVIRDDSGKPRGVISVGQDVTKHLQIENALRSDKSKLSMLNNCFVRFGNSAEENISQLAEIAWMLTGADRVLVREAEDDQLRTLSDTTIEVNDQQAEIKAFSKIWPEIRKIGKIPVLVEDIDDFAVADETLRGFKSMIVTVIFFGEEITGCLYCCFKEKVNYFPEEDLNLISIAARAIGVEIARLRENRQLHDMFELLDARDRRMSLEMEIARTVHRSFLPAATPEFSPYNIGFVFQPCFSVGGDFFDFVPFAGKNQLGILFADISGHGVAGALLSSMLKLLLFSATAQTSEPTEVLLSINDKIEENFPDGYFVTAFFTLLDQNSEKIFFASAAPEPVILLHKDGQVETLGRGGQPMGLLPSEFVCKEDFAAQSVSLKSGDTLIFFTDGITDIKISENERLGLPRLCEWCAELAGQPPQKICDSLYRQAIEVAIEKGIDDDIMLLAITRD